VIQIVGAGGPRAVMAALFLVATAQELGVSPTPCLIAVALGVGAAHMTPMSTPVNLVTCGPGAYEFGGYWKIGSLIVLWSLTVVVFIAPLDWPFQGRRDTEAPGPCQCAGTRWSATPAHNPSRCPTTGAREAIPAF
jgi:hypothetical protein